MAALLYSCLLSCFSFSFVIDSIPSMFRSLKGLFCDAGKSYTNITHLCDDCSVGKYQSENIAYSPTCSFCVAGKRYDTTSSACIECVAGKYQEENGKLHAVCKDCAAGKKKYIGMIFLFLTTFSLTLLFFFWSSCSFLLVFPFVSSSFL